jgi:hypothetical protein
VAQPGGAVLLKVLQPLYGDDALVGEVDVGGSGHDTGDVHQAVLLELESKDGGIFVCEPMLFDEPGYVDVVGWVLLAVGVQPQQQLCQAGTALNRPAAAQRASRCAASASICTRGGLRRAAFSKLFFKPPTYAFENVPKARELMPRATSLSSLRCLTATLRRGSDSEPSFWTSPVPSRDVKTLVGGALRAGYGLLYRFQGKTLDIG